MIEIKKNKLIYKNEGEVLIVEGWGENSLRIRSFPNSKVLSGEGALLTNNSKVSAVVKMIGSKSAEIQNGNIRAVLDSRNRLTFYNQKEEILLKEFIRTRAVENEDGSEDISNVTFTDGFNSTLKLVAREFKSNLGGDYSVTTRFESPKEERIYGMGQYQHPFLDLKYTTLELAQRNSQASIPFYLSNKGYGFLWNNPAIGKVSFSKNLIEWTMESTDRVDYWITAGDTPKEIERQYSEVVGRVPKMPDKLLGLWQSKLRYQTGAEVLEVVNQYKERNIDLSTIIIDFFHWPYQGDYRFDKKYWNNPQKLSSKLKEMGVEPIVSVWPTIEKNSENYSRFKEMGYLVSERRGIKIAMQTQADTNVVDMTNPEAREEVWKLLESNYVDNGYEYFWLDVAEPGYSVYDFDNYTYYEGTNLQCGNVFPNRYLKMIHEGLSEKENKDVVTLVRCAWAGSQKYGALLWSGDIDASFKAFRNQVNTGLNVGIAGIPWWTTDIGGFHGGDVNDEKFRELIIRWFQYATFSPILRMHGFRLPTTKPLDTVGGGAMASGASNEVWSYGERVEKILINFIRIREALQPYISSLMENAHTNGDPIMRPLFYHFNDDKDAWTDKIDNTYLFGEDLLVAPIVYEGQVSREVYLPERETWYCLTNGELFEGGQMIDVNAPLEKIILFVRSSKKSEFAEVERLLNIEYGEHQ